jgi:hypothetical protein
VRWLVHALVATTPNQSCESLNGPIVSRDQTRSRQGVVQKSESGTSSIEAHARRRALTAGPVCHPGFFFGACYGSNLQFEVKYGPERPATCCSLLDHISPCDPHLNHGVRDLSKQVELAAKTTVDMHS